MLGRLLAQRTEARHGNTSVDIGGFDQMLAQFAEFSFNGWQYIVPQSRLAEVTSIGLARNPIAWAAITKRAMVFSEARFQFQQLRNGRPGDLFGTAALASLERPWRGGSTSHLLSICELDASMYGNSFWIAEGGELVRLDPCRTMVVTGAVGDVERPYGERLVGYVVVDERGQEVRFFDPDEVAHYRPMPHPDNPWKGASWLATLAREIGADDELTKFKHAFLQNSATPNLVVKFEPGVSQEQFEAVRTAIESGHVSAAKAFRTLYLGGGADIQVVGANLDQIDLSNVQGSGETRIAAASGVPAVLLSIAEALQGSALNQGNYGAARRQFADSLMRPLWREVCNAFSTITAVPGGARLWYDERDVSFLQEDVMDAAEIKSRDAQTLESLVRSGFTPESAVQALASSDWSLLQHTGLVSVQLLPPGESGATAEPARHHELDVLTEVREALMVERVQQPAIEFRVDNMTYEQREQIVIQPAPVTVVQSPAPLVTVEPAVVNVAAPNVTVEGAVVNVPQLPPPVVNVPVTLEVPPMRHRVKRDAAGNIVEVVEEPA